MAYVKFLKAHLQRVDGFILQGPVSDREALAPLMSPDALKRSLDLALQMQLDRKEDDCMPKDQLPAAIESPISAYRWYALAGERWVEADRPGPGAVSPILLTLFRGDDDYFSSDLDDAFLRRCWGAFEDPVLILPSGEEEYVPAHVDKAALLERWMSLVDTKISPYSGLIPGANHTVDDPAAQEWMCRTVIRFLEGLEEAGSEPMQE
jgi:hypothetical protein